jgi:DNA-binding transcriptional LysR family regulator
MELRQFLAFKEVVERGGFTRAANHLHLTQSAVSQQVKALEEELGTALLHRVCRQIRLTDAGQVFLTHAKQILAQVEDAQSDVAEVVGGVKGNCRVACIPSIAPRMLPHLILGFRQTFPHVDIQTRVGTETQLLDWLKEGAVDVCITGLPVACEDVEEKIVMQEKFVLVVPVEHHFAGRITIKLEELFSECLISLPHDSVISSWFSTLCHDVGFKPNFVFESDDLSTRLGMVAAGLGISVESQYLVSCSGYKGTVLVEVEHPALFRDIGVIWRQSGHRLRNVENFLSILDQVIQQPDLMRMEIAAYPEVNEPLNDVLPADEMALI